VVPGTRPLVAFALLGVDAALVHAVLARVDGAAFDRAAGMAFQGETAMLVALALATRFLFPLPLVALGAAFPDVTVTVILASNRGPWAPIPTTRPPRQARSSAAPQSGKLPRQQHKRVFS